MELRLESHSIQQALAQASQLLKDRRLVVVFGDRLSLTSFALADPIRSSLVGAATTEDEGVELVLRTRPDLLICSSDLEIGYGVNLLRRVKAELPTCQLLIVLVRETKEVVQEAMLASADGVIFKSSLGTGHGDLIGALQTIATGGVYYPAEIRRIAAAAPRPELPPRGLTNNAIGDLLGVSVETTWAMRWTSSVPAIAPKWPSRPCSTA